ncbi:endothelin-converting enzyme homolog [Nematostella vectensis]|uniref:endothelin-converting enzyme homolog n=1 Tax=Nematostella vectensis TaxID=45351 RepID=UPI0020770227|nr:endothelin-converting enzyme homolog [Nematostella vectensis]
MISNANRYGTDEEVALNNSNTKSSTEVKLVSKHRHRAYSKSTRIFTLIILLLLVSCAVLIVLYTMERSRRIRAQRNTDDGTETRLRRVCTTKECVRTASAIISAMDEKVDPCHDFYMFACGGWKRDHPIPDDEPYWTQFIQLTEENFKVIRRLIESRATRKKYQHNPTLEKVFAYYDSCVDTNAINDAGLTPLTQIIETYGSWNITVDGWMGEWSMVERLAAMQRDLKIKPLISISVGADFHNSSVNRIMIDQTNHYITRESYLSNSSYNIPVRKAYFQLMLDIAGILGAEKNQEVVTQFQEIIDFEQELAKISLPNSFRVELSQMFTRMTVRQLSNETGNQLDWLTLLRFIFQDSGYQINEDEEVLVFAIDSMRKLVNLTVNTPKRVIRNYMMWQVVVNLFKYLGNRFQWPFRSFNMVVSGSSGATSSQWQKCLNEMSDNRNEISYPLGLLYVDEKFQKESREKVTSLINDLRESFISNLQSLDWMDGETKAKATEKARAIRQNIGYPDYIMDTEELNKRLNQLQTTNSSYFKNILNLREFSVSRNLQRLRVPVDKSRWIVAPHIVNAFYDRVTNKISFPAGILQPPFFDLDFPRVVSYGGIGIVVAHEITHGFDSNGRKYNKVGDLYNWWSNSSNDGFVNKSQCFVDQYSSIQAYGTYLNGKQTLGENIADNGAIKQAFMAYKTWVKQHGEEPLLPGLNYTNDQLFFISAAQVDCGSIRPQTARKKIELGTHTLDYWRVLMEMANSYDFSSAYNCPVGSRMNPKKKCELW